MGQAEQIRRAQLLERVKRLLDQHSKTWRAEDEPGAIRIVFDPDAAELGDEPRHEPTRARADAA
jgi:hypothetical protein